MIPSARTRLFAVLGDPVVHSLSPTMHNAGFRAAGLDALYVALRPAAHDVPALMASLARSGGGGNVTIPYKRIAADCGTTRDRHVERLGVANVFGGDGGTLQVGNTDIDGVLAAMTQLNAPSTAWLIAGTGGSARAVAGAAAERGARVAVQSRDSQRASMFAAWAESLGVVPAVPAECEVVINATPLGLAPGDEVPVDLDTVPRVAAVLDLVYRTDRLTAWVEDCGRRGIPALDGRETLLAQGAASWQFWFPGVAPPLEVMRAALDGRLV